MDQATLRQSQSQQGSRAQLPSPSHVRQLVFSGSITLAISLAGLPTSTFYVQAPRISYLPLLLAQIRTLYLPLVSDEVAVEDQMWFAYQGAPLKWHWPIGLLYDFHTAHVSLLSASAPPSLASYFNPPANASASGSRGELPTTFDVTLHLKDPPADALLLNSSIEVCRTSFMNMVKVRKDFSTAEDLQSVWIDVSVMATSTIRFVYGAKPREADYVRWGSVKRVTNLRKEQQDGLWDGVVQNDFDKFWSVGSKLIPLPSTALPDPREPTSSGSVLSDGRLPDAHAMRSVPLRVYLPEGAPVLQDVVPPLVEGRPNTLQGVLSTLAPLFFPEKKPPLAKALAQGIAMPLSTEIGWMGACLVGADGWLSIVLMLEPR